MSATIKIQESFGERCDACGQITDDPMVIIKSHCKETGSVQTWIHLKEFEAKFARAKKQFERKVLGGGIEGGEKG